MMHDKKRITSLTIDKKKIVVIREKDVHICECDIYVDIPQFRLSFNDVRQN